MRYCTVREEEEGEEEGEEKEKEKEEEEEEEEAGAPRLQKGIVHEVLAAAEVGAPLRRAGQLGAAGGADVVEEVGDGVPAALWWWRLEG